MRQERKNEQKMAKYAHTSHPTAFKDPYLLFDRAL